ncbi:MAG: hypothetical protein WAU56_18225 [Steroidobacteraceae bacterium]
MRTITVSTNVFARIWACREEGEETEDAILDRVLPGKTDARDSLPPQSAPNIGGHTERRYGVHFPGGFEIFRTYLGKEYRAKAVNTGWILLNDSKTYQSLNELSKAVGAKIENAWVNWFYSAADGQRRPIATLRDPTKIMRRSRSPVDVDKLLAELDAPPDQAQVNK